MKQENQVAVHPLAQFAATLKWGDVPEAVQRKRLMARDTVSAEQARASLRAQASREARRAIADDVVVNAGRLDELDAQVQRLHERYLQLSAAKRAAARDGEAS